MTKEIDSSVVTASQAGVVRPVILARLDFEGGLVAVNNSCINVEYDSETYIGVGQFGGVSEIIESAEAEPSSVTLSLSGVETAYIATAFNEEYQNRDARLYIALLDADHQLIGDPVLVYSGRMDTMHISGSTISLTVQSKMADWDRARSRRYNHEDQIAEYPDDLGLEFVPQMVEKELVWGRS